MRPLLPVLLAGVLAGTTSCCAPEVIAPIAGAENPDSTIEARAAVVDGVEANICVRRTDVDGAPLWPVEVALGGSIVSFSVSGAQPIVTTSEREVVVNGHRLTFSGGGRVVEVDGVSYSLPPGSAHMFGEGKYLGRFR